MAVQTYGDIEQQLLVRFTENVCAPCIFLPVCDDGLECMLRRLVQTSELLCIEMFKKRDLRVWHSGPPQSVSSAHSSTSLAEHGLTSESAMSCLWTSGR